MTDDEAFIRAIVDAPNDDAPRLIYADWLDERGDPRGEYLRAETEWAKPWREREQPKYSAHVWDLATLLDPIWVARVSRPPKGVCLDRFRIRQPGPPVTLDDIENFERRESIAMPDPFAAFLLNHNGGTLNRRLKTGFHRSRFGTVRMLPSTRQKPINSKSILLPLPNVQSLAEPAWGKVIRFADDRGKGSYLIGVISGVRGIIYYLSDREAWADARTVRAQTIAASLSELFADLT